jgi:hypothetical protein
MKKLIICAIVTTLFASCDLGASSETTAPSVDSVKTTVDSTAVTTDSTEAK